MQKTILAVSFLFLAGCKVDAPLLETSGLPAEKNVEILTTETGTIIMNNGSGYTLAIPKEMRVYQSDFFSTVSLPKSGEYPLYRDLIGPEDYDISIQHSSVPDCSPRDLGISSPVVELANDGDHLVWGEMTFRFSGNPDPESDSLEVTGVPCYPTSGFTAEFVLCGETTGEVVLICHRQVQRNEALARRIFESFQWTR